MTKNDTLNIRGFYPIVAAPDLAPFHRGDVLVLFGEIFQRGYANGLIEQARRQGLNIVYCTVGRRDENNQLVPLTDSQKVTIPEPFINIPLEAGFDFETDNEGKSLVDYLRPYKLSDWENFKLTEESLNVWKAKGQARFRSAVQNMLEILEKVIPEKNNIIFAHLMAGGVPRAKIVMPLMNRVVKGVGERYLSSEYFWNSGIGQACAANFIEVTAETFKILVEESATLRHNLEKHNRSVSYIAYGYHGTEILSGGQSFWQSYTPYLQGWAKLRLEEYAQNFFKSGISCCVYNCPEIMTQSSQIFQGVEVSLYPLLESLLSSRTGSDVERQKTMNQCQMLLKNRRDMDNALTICADYFKSNLLTPMMNFDSWPHHSTSEQLALMLETSDRLLELHENPRQLMTQVLSEVVFNSCGHVMLNDGFKPRMPVAWIGHQLVAGLV